MRILRVETLVSRRPFSKSSEWCQTREALHRAICGVVWTTGSKKFTIYPQSGKKRGEGNGVKPIKDGLMLQLKDLGWDLEVPLEISSPNRPGKLDAVFHTLHGPVAVEWETGNISSSHRALNKREFRVLSGSGRGSQVRLIGRFAPATPRFYRFPAGMDSSPSAQVQLLP